MAGADQFSRALGCQADTILVNLDFLAHFQLA